MPETGVLFLSNAIDDGLDDDDGFIGKESDMAPNVKSKLLFLSLGVFLLSRDLKLPFSTVSPLTEAS
jgi:hypothetical protein